MTQIRIISVTVENDGFEKQQCLQPDGFEEYRKMRLKLLLSVWLDWASLLVQMVKNLPAMQETWVQSLGREDPLEKGMAVYSSLLAWRILWTEEPGGLQSMGRRVGHDWATNNFTLTWLGNSTIMKDEKWEEEFWKTDSKLFFTWIELELPIAQDDDYLIVALKLKILGLSSFMSHYFSTWVTYSRGEVKSEQNVEFWVTFSS